MMHVAGWMDSQFSLSCSVLRLPLQQVLMAKNSNKNKCQQKLSPSISTNFAFIGIGKRDQNEYLYYTHPILQNDLRSTWWSITFCVHIECGQQPIFTYRKVITISVVPSKGGFFANDDGFNPNTSWPPFPQRCPTILQQILWSGEPK